MEQLKRLQSIEREMLSEGKSSSEIDAFKAALRRQQNAGTTPQINGVASLSETALNMNRGPRGIAAYMADGGETSVVRLGGRKTKNTPRPVNAPVGRQSMTLTDEDIGTLVDFTPIAGDIKGGVEGAEFISEEFKRENPNYLLMGIVGGAAVVGVIPFAGDAAQKMIMRGAKNFRKNRVTEETLNMLSEQDAALVRNLTRKTPATKPSPGQNLADNIASDLRSGKINKVTDARLEGLDFQGEIRLRQHYIDGNVGTDADGVTITLANREQRMIDQGYNRVGVHGATPTLSNSFSQDGSVNDIRVFQPSSGGKSGEGVYLDIEAEGYAQDSLFSKSLGLSPYPTANKHAGFWNDGAHTPVREGATMYPLVARTDLATPKTLRNLRTQTVPLTPVQKIKKKFGLLNYTDVLDAQGKNAINTLKKQGYTGVNSPDYGEITSFDASGLRVPTAIFDPRLTNLKNIGMADGGAVMNGIGSLSETARNMSRGPRGIGAYQQFAEGGATIKGELNVDLQPLDLPVDGRMSYTKTDDGGSFDSEIRKTFEGGLGSLTPSFDYSTQNSSRNMGDVVIDENGEQIGFAVEGELFLNSDPNSEDKVRGAFEVEKSRNNTNFTFPEGEFVRTDEGLFKRFNLGMDLGKFGLDLNRMEGSGRDPVNSGSATIRIGENGIVRYSDSDRGEPTIGFNYAKEFADGGPVYMAGGGSLSRYTELRDGNKQNTFTALQGVDAERLKRQRGYYERGPDAIESNVYTGDTGSRLLLPVERPQGNNPAVTDRKPGYRYLPPGPYVEGGPVPEGSFVGPDHPLYDTLPSGFGNTMGQRMATPEEMAEKARRDAIRDRLDPNRNQRESYQSLPDSMSEEAKRSMTFQRFYPDKARQGLDYFGNPIDSNQTNPNYYGDELPDFLTSSPTMPFDTTAPLNTRVTQPTFTMPTLEDAKRLGVTTDPFLTNSNVFPADGYTTVGLGRDRANVQRINPFNQQQAQQNAMRRQDNLRGLASPFATSFRRPHQNVQHQLMYGGPQQSQRARQQNPFEGNEQYQALMDYQKTMRPNEDQRAQMQSLMDAMQPNQEQRDRMGELRTAFEGTGGYKDYRIQQMEQQLQQRQRQNPRMGMGLGSQRPQGMGMFGGFPQRPQQMPQGIMGGYGQQPYQQQYGGFQGGYGGGMQGGYGGMGGYGRPQQNPYGGGMNSYQQPQQQMPQPTYQPYQNPYQQQSPQPQQYGGYGMGQSQGGFGGYGGISNPYQPQQYGNQNNSMGYQQPRY